MEERKLKVIRKTVFTKKGAVGFTAVGDLSSSGGQVRANSLLVELQQEVQAQILDILPHYFLDLTYYYKKVNLEFCQKAFQYFTEADYCNPLSIGKSEVSLVLSTET